VTSTHKFLTMFEAIGLFVALVGAILAVASRFSGRRGDRVVAAAFLLPTVALISVGLVYPGLKTIYQSLYDAAGSSFIGFDNYKTIFTDSDQITVLRNTVLWVLITPFVATGVGLLYAILVDKARVEALAKALIFLPMAISFVGASIIWKLVYDYQGTGNQIGLLNAILVGLGGSPQRFLTNPPWNTLFLIVIMVWIQAGFAMVILSAAIKAISTDIVEAARLDGVNARQMFRNVTLPSIRPAVIVVVTTITIATLKVFDIVRTVTGGNFDTSVVANALYDQAFVFGDGGKGSALAVLLFVLVLPVVVYQVRVLRSQREIR